MFFSHPHLCEDRSRQQLRGGKGGVQFIAWNITQHKQSHDGNVEPIMAKQGERLLGK